MSFPNYDIVYVIPVGRFDFILISGSGFQESLIGDGAAPIGQNEELAKTNTN